MCAPQRADGYKYGLNLYNPDASGMNIIRDYILDNKRFAKKVIEAFNETHLLEIQGEKYKKKYYSNERISFTHEENLSAVFYKREILDYIFWAFDSVNEVYFMLKEAL